ncbi:MAG TPA: polyphosphate kinase 2 family protein [Thermoanaerobaculia bacterium]|nr:polyphosphate kinase 2 family protein [Thermoanaerobaculia bacterium]
MNKSERRLVRRCFIAPGEPFRLRDHDPGDTAALDYDKHRAGELLRKGTERLAGLQDRLFAQDRWSLLLIFQAVDAAGKDGTIKHVMSGVNPQGCEVYSFRAPSAEELDHTFLWRAARRLPERGRIGIFNRSHYEEVLVVRVHPELLSAQKLPRELATRNIWKERYEDINGFERHLARNSTVIRKFFLNVSRKEQKKRLLARLDDPDKNWKFSIGDVGERALWKDYMSAYEKTIEATSTPWAPWYVVPADNKWFTRLVVADVIVAALEGLDLAYPRVGKEKRRELAKVRKAIARS